MSTTQLARHLLLRMREIETRYVTKSAYRALSPAEQDEPPTGDTYNLLFDACLDELPRRAISIRSNGKRSTTG